MNRTVLPVVVVAAACAVLLLVGGADGSSPTTVPPDPVPHADPAGALTSSWFCPSPQGGPATDVAATIDIANTTSAPRTGTVRWLAAATGTATVAPFSVGPGAVLTVAAPPASSALVQSTGGGVVVEQSAAGTTGRAVAHCASDTSPTWYTANGSTLVDATEVLSLFNPFPSDAVVDIEFSTEEGREAPGAVQGLVIPAGRTTFVDATATVRRQQVTAAAVRARTGQLVVTRLQRFDGSAGRAGLSLTLAARAAAVQWTFPNAASTAADVTGWQVFNPDTREAEVTIASFPTSGDAPEPIDITVPPRSQVTVPAARDGGVPTGVPFTSTVTSSNEVPVVAERLVDVRAPDTHPGWTSVLGSPAPARRLAFAAGDTSAGAEQWLAIFNPGQTPAKVDISSMTAAGRAPIAALQGVVVPPSSQVVFRMNDYVQAAPLGLEIDATEPVVVDRTMTTIGATGLSITAGVPLADPG
ncbi:MAG TPA: DUF5719 family protein [Acidimicrobiales bacterium]